MQEVAVANYHSFIAAAAADACLLFAMKFPLLLFHIQILGI
jgi:hypothetical protein